MVDTRDNHVYRTVKIGDQTWMAENLAYLPSVNKPSATVGATVPLYFVLNYDGEDVAAAKATEEYKKYGVLYNWYGAMDQENAQGGSADARSERCPGNLPRRLAPSQQSRMAGFGGLCSFAVAAGERKRLV